MTACGCTDQLAWTTSCQAGYSGEGCTYELPGNYCGSKGHLNCYIGYAYNITCVGAKKKALVRDDPEMSLATLREAKTAACGDRETLTRWLATAPGFPPRKASQSGGL